MELAERQRNVVALIKNVTLNHDKIQTDPVVTVPSDRLVPLESVLCTEELAHRPSRPPDYETENRALVALVQALADAPRTMLQTLAEKILEVFKADSAALSLLTKDGKRFCWLAIAGMWKPHIGCETPRDFSPCGDVLDHQKPLLFRHPELRYSYLLSLTPPAAECLLVPFYVEGKAVGTIWAIAHNEGRKFDAEDLRQLENFARFASAAFQATEVERLHHPQAALNVTEDDIRSRELTEALNRDLHSEIAQRKVIEQALHFKEQQLQADLADTKLLQRISAEITHEERLEVLYEKILDVAMAVMQSDMASMQVVDEGRNGLRLLAWRGFESEFGRMFELVGPDTRTSCGVASREAHRVVVPDVEEWDFIVGTTVLDDYRRSGIRAVQSTPLYARNGNLVGIISTHWKNPHEPTERDLRLLDILVRQAADLIERSQAKQTQARLAAIVESSQDAIISKDLDGIITSWNEGAERLFGYTAEEAIGQPITMLFPHDRLDEEPRILERVRRGERTEHYETVRCRKDGTLLDVSVTISPIRDAEGKIVSASKIARDVTERRRAEKVLRQHTAQFETLLNEAPLGVYLVDADFRIRQVNPAALPVFGGVAGLIGRRFNEVIHILWPKAYAEEIVERFRHTLETGEPCVVPELIMQRLDHGVTEYYEWQINRIPLPDGRYGVVCYFRSISAQVQARERIVASEERFRTLVSVLTDVPWTTDAEGAFVTPQAAWEAYTGQSWEEYRGFGWINALHPEDREKIRATWRHSCESGSLFHSHGRVWHARTQQYRHFEARAAAVFNGGDKLREWVGTFTDVHERKVAEETLRASEARFRLVADAVPVMIWLSGTDKLCTWFNKGWLEFVGRSLEQEIGKGWTENVHPDDLERCLQIYSSSFDTRASFSMEYRLKRRDGEYRWVIDEGIPLYGLNGEFTGYIGSAVDITERKRAEETLHETDRRKDEFLAMLGHELRNPLGVISTIVQLMRFDASLDPKSEEYRQTIELEVKQITRLLNDLLDISRIARGLIRLKKEPCELGAIIRQVGEAHRAMLEESGLELALHGLEGPFWVMGDSTRLGQIIGNLIHNANKFTDRGGCVDVELRTRTMEQTVLLTVRDSGIGMEPDLLARLFDPFVQAEKSLDRSRGGLGLGLALVKRLVELHGGNVTATSEGLGKGSKFTVSLPLIEAPALAVNSVEARAQAIRSRRILVIEDNLAAAQTLQVFLSKGGHSVEVALNGLEGIEVARRFRPEVVLCDIGLPESDGYAVAQALRREPKVKGTYLIAVSGYGQDADQRRAFEAGFDSYLTKPIDLQALEELLGKSTIHERAAG